MEKKFIREFNIAGDLSFNLSNIFLWGAFMYRVKSSQNPTQFPSKPTNKINIHMPKKPFKHSSQRILEKLFPSILNPENFFPSKVFWKLLKLFL